MSLVTTGEEKKEGRRLEMNKVQIKAKKNLNSPNLQFDLFTVELNGLHFEIDADGRDERRIERVVREAA